MLKKFISFSIAALLCLLFCVSGFALETNIGEIPSERLLPRLNDEADLLSQSDEASLTDILDRVSEENEFDVVIAAVNSLNGKTAQEYADDYYDYNGFGYGENADGALLLISMQERDWYISATGSGSDIIGDDWVYIGEEITPYLSDGDYFTAFRRFAYICEDYVQNGGSDDDFYYQYGGDDYYADDYYSGYYAPENNSPLIRIVFSIVAGMLISLIVMFAFRSKLKSVRRKPAARDYQIPGSMQVTQQSDMLIYTHINRTPRQTQTRTGGSRGGSVHVGSSGRSHGGGGGKF